MDPTTFLWVSLLFAGLSLGTAIAVAIVGCVCLTPMKMMRVVFPYIKKCGNHNVVFGFIISKRAFITHYSYMLMVVALIVFVILFNAALTTSTKYNPYDELDCFASYNGSKFKLESEEQAEMENATNIRCYGWNTDIAGGIGHAAAILTLSWVFISIVLWLKLNLGDKFKNCILTCNLDPENSAVLKCCIISPIMSFHILFSLCISVLIMTLFILVAEFDLGLKEIFDAILISANMVSGTLVIPMEKKPKSLADCCKEAVQKNQEKEAAALEDIKKEVKKKVQGHQIQVDLLLELAELECKKALADVYYYGDKKERENLELHGEEIITISEEQMKTIAQVAYSKIPKVPSVLSETTSSGERSEEEQTDDQSTDTISNSSTENRQTIEMITITVDDEEATPMEMSINSQSEREGLLDKTRINKTYL